MATENPIKSDNLEVNSAGREAGEILKQFSPEQQAALKDVLNNKDAGSNIYRDTKQSAASETPPVEASQAVSSETGTPKPVESPAQEMVNNVEILKVMQEAQLIKKGNNSSKAAREALESLGIN